MTYNSLKLVNICPQLTENEILHLKQLIRSSIRCYHALNYPILGNDNDNDNDKTTSTTCNVCNQEINDFIVGTEFNRMVLWGDIKTFSKSFPTHTFEIHTLCIDYEDNWSLQVEEYCNGEGFVSKDGFGEGEPFDLNTNKSFHWAT